MCFVVIYIQLYVFFRRRTIAEQLISSVAINNLPFAHYNYKYVSVVEFVVILVVFLILSRDDYVGGNDGQLVLIGLEMEQALVLAVVRVHWW